MKVLFITPYLPSETSGHAGAQLIFRNVMALAKNHDVTIASFVDKNETEKSLKTKILKQEHKIYFQSIISVFR